MTGPEGAPAVPARPDEQSVAEPVKRMCPGCDREIKVYHPKLRDGRYDELHFQNHYLNPLGYTNPGDRGDRCMNSGCPVSEAIVVPIWRKS